MFQREFASNYTALDSTAAAAAAGVSCFSANVFPTTQFWTSLLLRRRWLLLLLPQGPDVSAQIRIQLHSP
jgi:hypothetical protein